MNKGFLIKAPIFLYVFAVYSLVFLGEEAANLLRREDGPIESLGAIYFLIASILYFASFVQSSGLDLDKKSPQIKKNYFYIFFSVLFFVGFGEEISWGQRLMDLEAPQIFQEINKHKETNLHNLKIFGKGMLRPDIWFFIFWFSYCLILPAMNKYSLESRNYMVRIGFPVPPLWIGYLLLVNITIYCIPQLFPSDWPQTQKYKAFLEIMESNAAFIFSVLAFHELKKQLLIKKAKLMKEEQGGV